MREGAAKKRRVGISLNVILWLAFSAFALLVIVIFVLVQNSLILRQYRENTVSLIEEARGRMAAALGEADTPYTLGLELTDIANDYGLSVALVYENGESALAFDAQTDRSALAEALSEQQAAGRLPGVFISPSAVSYAEALSLEGRGAFLFLTAAVQQYGELMEGMQWLSLITALVAVVLAFVASGFVAALITKPVTEVTARAKELARGNYDLRFKKNYYCAELTELADALEYARDEVSKADTMQKELIANVSHDFKTPLTMIKAYASMIREISGDDKKKRDANAKVIIDECDRLTLLVGDVLDLSKLRAGMNAGERTVFNLSEEVYSVTERFAYLRETENYTIETQIEDDLYANANRERIDQVLYNLIGNAVNYTGEDKRVRVKLYKKGKNARFEVIDSGKGIPPEEVDTLWDRYYRSNKTHKRPVNGSGLGLSIVKNILLQHDCPFGVISEVGKGSCFWAEFAPPPDEAPAEPHEKRSGNGKENKENKEGKEDRA